MDRMPVRKRPVQLEGLVWRRRYPGLDFVRRRQDHWHRLRMYGGVWLRREKREDVVNVPAYAGPLAGPRMTDPCKAAETLDWAAGFQCFETRKLVAIDWLSHPRSSASD